MQNASLKYVLLGIILILIAGSAGYYFYYRQPAGKIVPSAPAGGAAQTSATSTSQTIPPSGASPQVNLNLKGTSTVAVKWQDLPAGTNIVAIYRSLTGTNKWVRWQTISSALKGVNGEVSTLTNGAADIPIGKKENLSSYAYYFQAISGSGNPLFTSASAQSGSPQSPSQSPGQPQNGQNSSLNFGGSGSGSSTAPIGGFNLVMAASSAPSNQTQNNGFNQGNGGSSSTPPQPPQPPASPAPTGTPPVNPNPPAPAASSTATSTIPKSIPTGTVSVAVQGMYYSPDGTPTGSGTQEANFWVLHVNDAVEIGWQNLPANTNDIIVYRSASASGPWVKLLEQKNPIITEPSFVRLADNTIGTTYYYRLDAYAGAAQIATYGPVLLPVE